MGCDIHFHVEQRMNDGRWRRAEATIPNRWAGDDGEPKFVRESWYEDRNYHLFAILADVRNGVGFAGVETGMGFVPIAPPRGLPPDVSNEVLAEAKKWGVDGHSVSYFTVRELLAYDWHQTTKLRAVVKDVNEHHPKGGAAAAAEAYAKAYGELPGWVDRWVPLEPTDEWKSFYYEAPYWMPAQRFIANTLTRMARLADGDLDSVRCVFWFDS